MNKQLIIFLFFLCISSEMLFSAESEAPPLKRSKMEAGQIPRRSSRIAKRVRECDVKELAEKTITKKQRIAGLRSLGQKEKDTQLEQAIQKGSLRDIESLLEANASPDSQNKAGWPFIFMVAGDWYAQDFRGKDDYDKSVHLGFIEKYPKIMELFLAKGKADQNAYQIHPLFFVVSDCYGRFFCSDSCYDRDLHSAALDSDSQILTMLLPSNADPELRDKYGNFLLQVIEWDYYGQYFGSSVNYDKKLHLKYLEIKLACMKKLLNYANPNAKNRKTDEAALHIVSQDLYKRFVVQPNFNEEFYLEYLDKNAQFAQVLLDGKADPNIQDAYNNTPLHISCLEDNAPMVRLLLKRGTDFTKRNKDGLMPQHLAAQKDSLESLGLLLQYGADLSERTIQGETVLSLASPQMKSLLHLIKKIGIAKNKLFLACMFKPNSDLVSELIEKNVNINQTDAEGQTPLMWVVARTTDLNPRIQKASLNVMDLLLKARADTSVEANDGTTVLELGNDEAKKKIRNHNLAQGRQEVFEIMEKELPGEKAYEKNIHELILELTGTYEPIQ